MDIVIKLPVWLCKELQRDAEGKSYQTTIKRILKEHYEGVDRRYPDTEYNSTES